MPRSGIDGIPFSVPDAVSEHVVVRTSTEWSALWERLGGTGDPPAIDFASEMIVGVVIGDRGATLSYQVRIDRVTARGDDVTVKFTETDDRKHVFPAIAVSPRALVRVPSRSGRVQFERRVRVIR